MRVYGRVQGVGFRYFTQQVARRLHICGTVRNLPDSSVEIFAAGASENLDEFISAIRQGPAFSRVTDVAMEDCNKTFDTFRVIL